MTDLHWGKGEVARKEGVPLPGGTLAEDLARLARAVERTGAERILALGDLVHARAGLTSAVVDEVAQWRAARPRLRFQLIRGNHDARVAFPPLWAVESAPAEEPPFAFRHEPGGEEVAGVAWAGHVHPCVVLRGGRDRLRLPCFVVRAHEVLMPAFGGLTGGFEVRAAKGERIYAVAGEQVMLV